MRSRVVPIRDMKEKYGAQVESFRYAFVIPDHGSDWDPNAMNPDAARKPEAWNPSGRKDSGRTSIGQAPSDRQEAASTQRRRATDKLPTFIEIKPRAD